MVSVNVLYVFIFRYNTAFLVLPPSNSVNLFLRISGLVHL